MEAAFGYDPMRSDAVGGSVGSAGGGDGGDYDSEFADEDSVDFGEVSLYDLLGALKSVLVRYDREHPPTLHLSGERFSTRDQFQRLLKALTAERPVDLLDDLGSRSCRSEAVAAFLAVLELCRLNLVSLHQTSTGQVLMYRTDRQAEAHELEAIIG